LIVYAGAVVVLFLFVIMLLGPEAAAPAPGSSQSLFSRWVAGVGTVILSAAGISTMLFWDGSGKVPAFPALQGGEGSIESMAQEVFTTGLVPFEIASALLLVAIVGAVAVARGRQGEAERSKHVNA